ncbi:MAG: sigma-70 family RNA polymerase sigma factor [Planctomycetota bacterium]|nr:MAG: sigma-70 family RNA polymerase sigma factor [Planctomycetota bacterium]
MAEALAQRSDEELILACRGATPEAARALVGELAARHLERLAGFLSSITGDPSEALDLAQEAFVRVYRNREKYREVARFRTWLYTIGRNLALNELRDRKRRPRAGPGRPTADGEEPGAVALAPAEDDGPAEAVAREDLQERVRREIRALPPHYAAVVVLCDLEERTYAEAAEVLDVPVGTVRSRLSRARERLAQRLRSVLT